MLILLMEFLQMAYYTFYKVEIINEFKSSIILNQSNSSYLGLKGNIPLNTLGIDDNTTNMIQVLNSTDYTNTVDS